MQNLKNFIGQTKIKKQLKYLIYPNLKKFKYCDHILLEGAPGTGKTTLAYIIANDNKLPFKKIIASMLKKKSDLISLFCDIEEGTVIFLDEVHRLDIVIEEMLYQIMDEKKINIILGKEGDARFISIDLPNFTIISATTLSGLLTKPFKDRFSYRLYLQDYEELEIQEIIEQHLFPKIGTKFSSYISKHSKNVPRIAINIAKRVNDYSKYIEKDLNYNNVDEALELVGYKLGLNTQDTKYLTLLKTQGPMSINTLATKMSVEKVNIISEIEPYLLKKDYISLSSKGRNITKQGIKLLKVIK